LENIKWRGFKVAVAATNAGGTGFFGSNCLCGISIVVVIILLLIAMGIVF
jgi:hypothetical protein